MELLSVRDLHKSYEIGAFSGRRQVHALAGVDLDLREGEVLGILGSNGAGKSTMAMVAAGLMEPDCGVVRFEGSDVATMSRGGKKRFRQAVQLVQQDPFEALSPRLKVGDSVAEPLRLLSDLDSAERLSAIESAFRAVRLPSDSAFLARYPHELSGGQLQRVNIARALVLRPKVLILDEPVAMLDPSEQAEVLHLLKDAQVQSGMAMIVVSHDLPVLFRIADRIAVMNQGKIEESGNSDTLLRSPKTPFTRSLIDAIRLPVKNETAPASAQTANP